MVAGGGGAVMDDDMVTPRVRSANADRAQFLGLAFSLTFLLAALGDLAGMGTLRHHGFMVGQLLLSLAVFVVGRWTSFGQRHATTVFAAGMTAVSAAGAAHLSQFGGLDGPWFYGSYTAPSLMIPMLIPLRERIAWTSAAVLAFVVVYWLMRPDVFAHPMAHVPLIYLATISGISISLGNYIYRLELRSFVDVARLSAAATVLEGQLRRADEQPARLRRELARQMHDEVAQLITGARLHVDGWNRTRTRDDAGGRLAELLDELADRSRQMLDELRAPAARGPLVTELEALRTSYDCFGLAVDLLVEDGAPDVAVDVVHTDALVGSAREALTNAVRHGRASEATISVHLDAALLTLSVLDNGGGTINDVREGNGITGIRERVADVGGHLVVSDYSEGLRLTVTIPRRLAA